MNDEEYRKAQAGLDLKYATGEIDQPELKRLRAVLLLAKEAPISEVEKPRPPELLLRVDDLAIYSDHISTAGKDQAFSDIRIQGSASVTTVNFVPVRKHSQLHLSFKDGTSYKLAEHRKFFGKARHKSIMQAKYLLEKLTFQPLMQELFTELREHPVRIGTENAGPVFSLLTVPGKLLRGYSPIVLHADATINNGRLTFDLKQCRRDGIIELGIYRQRLSEPDSVYIADRQTKREQSHHDALRFALNGKYRTDVVRSVINWLAEPGNTL